MTLTTKKLSKTTYRVLIVDDHPVVREGLALRISQQPDLEVCGSAADVAEALHLATTTQPDVAIIDIALKTGNGIDLIKRIKAHGVPVRMLVLSMYNESLYAERVLRAGAMGYINKENAPDQIINAIRQVLAGNVYLSESMIKRVLHRAVGETNESGVHSDMESLSDRELEVFKLIGQGMNTIQIAETMHLSIKTVETYRARIKQKLNLSTMSELIQRATVWALENG